MSAAAIAACIMLVLLMGPGAGSLAYLRREDQLAQRILEVQRRVNMQPDLAAPAGGAAGLLRPVEAVGSYIARSGLLSLRTLQELQQTLHTAGLRGRTGLSLFVGAKIILLAGLPLVVFVLLSQMGWWLEVPSSAFWRRTR